jgi:hypothetical protein
VTATADSGRTAEPAPGPAPHQHEWRLVAVDYDDLREVRELLCQVCHQTSYE